MRCQYLPGRADRAVGVKLRGRTGPAVYGACHIAVEQRVDQVILGIAQREGAAAVGQRQRAVQIEDGGVGVLGPLAIDFFAEAGKRECLAWAAHQSRVRGARTSVVVSGKVTLPLLAWNDQPPGISRAAHVPEQECFVRS
ncbi:MAG: hypothetical protein R2838_16740 [Caldilineaceae bacterium]